MAKDMIELSKSTVRIDENGIIISEYKKDSKLELEDAYRDHEATLELTGGKICTTLVDLTNVRTISKEARSYFSNVECAEVFEATALYVNTPISRIIGNFFLGINRPAIPVRLLNNPQALIRRIPGILSTVNAWATWVAFTAQPLGLRIRGDVSMEYWAWDVFNKGSYPCKPSPINRGDTPRFSVGEPSFDSKDEAIVWLKGYLE